MHPGYQGIATGRGPRRRRWLGKIRPPRNPQDAATGSAASLTTVISANSPADQPSGPPPALHLVEPLEERQMPAQRPEQPQHESRLR